MTRVDIGVVKLSGPLLWIVCVLAGGSGDNSWYIALIPFRCVHPQRKGAIVSVQSRLGLGPEMESVIANAWEGWVEKQPRLAAVTEPHRLQAWRCGVFLP